MAFLNKLRIFAPQKSYTHAMREKKYKSSCWSLLLIVLATLATSCSEDSTTVTSNDYCYIKSVTLGTVKRVITKYDRMGNFISSTNAPFSGNTFAITIDQRTGAIENRDSLPYGSQLSAVIATITFEGATLAYRTKGTEDTWVAYNSIDSLDLTKPLELLLTSVDQQSSRTYTLNINVHKQEGDSLYWSQCESEISQLADMEHMKAFILNDKLMILGKNATGIVLAERSGIEMQGTWQVVPTENLPHTADIQTLQQQEGCLYLSTSDGEILSSTDAKKWEKIGGGKSVPLTLIEKTKDHFYALSEGKILRSSDAQTWEEEQLDSDPMFLPTTGIRALSVKQSNGNNRIVLIGQREQDAVVWNKMWNKSENETTTKWTYFPNSPDNTTPCPRLQHFNLLEYDSNCIAFGGSTLDNSRKALDALYISQDYGITWRPSTELHLPIQLEGIEGCIASAVDKNNFIWVITNAQVWRGRLNRLGFEQQ